MDEAKSKALPKLAKFLTQTLHFTTQEDAIKAMQVGRDVYDAMNDELSRLREENACLQAEHESFKEKLGGELINDFSKLRQRAEAAEAQNAKLRATMQEALGSLNWECKKILREVLSEHEKAPTL